jgi:translation elongation factor EF-G
MSLLKEYKCTPNEILSSIIAGFTIACASGPLCNEPIMGVLFIVEKIERVEKIQGINGSLK